MRVSAWLRRLEPDHLYDHLIIRELASGITYDAETGLLTKGYGSTGVGVQLQRTTPAEIIAEMGQGVSLGDLGITEYLVSGQSIAHDLALLFIGRTPGNAYVTLGARQRADIDALEGAGLWIMDMYDLKREDILYGTDVRERIADLESERDAYIDERLSKLGDDAQDDETMHDAYASEWAEANPSEAEELRKLEEFNEEAEGYGDGRNWDAVNEDYFESYAEQLASDIGAIQPDAGWPLMFIDWKAAAEALKQDYTEIELDGQSFWTR